MKLNKLYEDQVPGGLADDAPDSEFDKDQLARGIKAELEHTDDKVLAKEIAKDHLKEYPNYYDALEKMEDDLDEARDYKREYRLYHGKPAQRKQRADRNKARRKMGLKDGDGKEVQHNKPLSQGGSNSKANLSVTTDKEGQRKEGNEVKYQNEN